MLLFLVAFFAWAASVVESSSLGLAQNIIFSANDTLRTVDLSESYYMNHSFVYLKNIQNGSNIVSPIPSPLIMNNKYSYSMMFWPVPYTPGGKDPMNRAACKKRFGLSALNWSEVVDYSTELTNSMTYFERVKVNTSAGMVHYAIALELDKTLTKNTILQLYQAKFNEVYSTAIGQFRCDWMIHIKNDQYYIFCWRVTRRTDPVVGPVYTLSIKTRQVDSRTSEDNTTSDINLNLTSDQYEIYNKPSPDLSLRVIPLKTQLTDILEVAMYFRSQTFFAIYQIKNGMIDTYKYPLQYSGLSGEKNYPELVFNSRVAIYTIDYVDEAKFLITQFMSNFSEYNKSSYGQILFLDASQDRPPRFVGQGMVVSLYKAVGESNEMMLSHVTVITDAQNLTGSPQIPINSPEPIQLTVQNRKYYKGYFYGDLQFKLSITGRPRLFKGFMAQSVIVYADFTRERTSPECPGNAYSDVFIRVAAISRPDIARLVLNFTNDLSNPKRVHVTPNNNMIYLRSPHKLEVYRLSDITLSFSEQGDAEELNRTRLFGNTSIIRMVTTTTMNETEASMLMKDTQAGKYIQILNNANFSVMNKPRITTNLNNKPVSEDPITFLNMNYPKHVYLVSTPFEDVAIGNFLKFETTLDGTAYVSMKPFENRSVKLPPNPTNDSSEIHSMFAMDYKGNRFVLVSYQYAQGNFLYRIYEDEGKYKANLTMKLYDNRMIDSILQVSSSKYLTQVQGLLYELDVSNFTLNPIFSSNDYCGDIWTPVKHSDLGMLTICGGKNELRLYNSDPSKKRIDLSDPLTNIRINPTMFFLLKTEGIGSVIASMNFPNRFIILTKPSKETSVMNQVSYKLTMRMFEICPSRQFIELKPETEVSLSLSQPVAEIQGRIISSRLVLFIKYNDSQDAFSNESIYVYVISASFALKLEKQIYIPQKVRLNTQTHQPLLTYLPVKKTLMTAPMGNMILMMVSLQLAFKDPILNFDFFNSDAYKQSTFKSVNYMAVFDPQKSASDCIKIFEIPDEYEPTTFGYLYMEGNGTNKPVGTVIATKKDKNIEVFFMDDHSLSIRLHSFERFDSYFNSPRQELLNFSMAIRDILHSESIKLNIFMRTRGSLNSLTNLSLYKKNYDIDLVTESGSTKIIPLVVKAVSTNSTDLIGGFPHSYNFKFDSLIEKASGQINAEFHFKIDQCAQQVVNLVKNAVAYTPSYQTTYNSFVVRPFETMYPLNVNDYDDLIYASKDIVIPIVERSDNSIEIRANPNLSGKRRCVSSTFKPDHVGNAQGLIVCIGISFDIKDEINALEIYIFEEKPTKENMYSVNRPEPPALTLKIDPTETPFDDVSLLATLNHFVIMYTNTETRRSYNYTVYKITRNSANKGFVAKEILGGDIWLIGVQVSNTYYDPKNGTGITERFCMVACSNLEKIVFTYLCHVYEPSSTALLRPEFKTASVFQYFDYEDASVIYPMISIFSLTNNVVAVDNQVVDDPRLYFIFSFPASIAVFARLNITNPTLKPNLEDETQFSFEVLCNPFEGFKFEREYHYSSERYLVRIAVYGQKTYLIFYSLPSEYVDLNLNNYRYKSLADLKKAQEDNKNSTGAQLSCLQSKFVKVLDFPVTGVTPIMFQNKGDGITSETRDNPELAAFKDVTSHLSNIPLVFPRTALQLILQGPKETFYRVEYLPRIEVKAQSSLLLSDNVIVEVKGMFDSSTELIISLNSGKISQLWFVVKYLMPLVILIGLIIFFNYAVVYFFQHLAGDSSIKEKGIMGSPNARMTRMKTMKAKSGVNRADTLGNAKNLEMDLSLNRKAEEERLRDARYRRIKREAMNTPLMDMDQDYAEDVEHAEFLRKRFMLGVFTIDLDEAEQELVNKSVFDMRMATFASAADEKEKMLTVSDETLEDYAKFEKYMIDMESQKSVKKRLSLAFKPGAKAEIDEYDKELGDVEENSEENLNSEEIDSLEGETDEKMDSPNPARGDEIAGALARLKHVAKPQEKANTEEEALDHSGLNGFNFEDSSDEALEDTQNKVEELRARIESRRNTNRNELLGKNLYVD